MPKRARSIEEVNKVENLYKKVPKEIADAEDIRTYPDEETYKMSIPFQGVAVGKTGSGKTTAILSMVMGMNCWDYIVLCAKKPDEKLYASLQHRLDKKAKAWNIEPDELYQVCESLEDLPDIDEFDSDKNNLVLIDDMITSKDSELGRASDYVIRGRKNNVSTVFFSHSYFMTPPLLRGNVDWVWIFRIMSTSNLRRMVNEWNDTDHDHWDVVRKIKQAWENRHFVTVDINATSGNRFRLNYSLPLFEGTTTELASNNAPPVV